MIKFVNTVTLEGTDNSKSQLDFDTNVLSAAVVYMCDYYEKLFSDLDSILKLVSDQENNP